MDRQKTAVITGASRGIGAAIACRLASQGYRLVVIGRDPQALQQVVWECNRSGDLAFPLTADLSDTATLDGVVAECVKQLGHIDVLVNNAGSSSRAAVQDADLDTWLDVMALNFTAALALSHLVLAPMIARKSGAIINISSISGRHTGAGGAIYSASKHAINGFTGCMFDDVREHGIKVSAIMPGFVDTALTADLGKQASAMIRADDVADAVDYVLQSSSNCCPTEIVLRPQRQP